MGCIAVVNESIPGAVNLTSIILELDRQDKRQFFGYGIFETTAVIVACFVAGYALIPDPTGTQDSHDLSEYSVYSQWRTAVLCIVGDLIFSAVVIGHQLVHEWRGRDMWWLVALLFTPWAPLAGQVRKTLGAGRRVRFMMRTRVACNSLTAVLREGLYIGSPGLSTLAVGQLVFNVKSPPEPEVPDLGTDEDDSKRIRGLVQEAMATSSGRPLTKAALREGPQLQELSPKRMWLFKMESRLDPVARAWSRNQCVSTDFFVEERPTASDLKEQAQASAHWWTRLCPTSQSTPMTKDPFKRALLLDVIDRLQPGGTVSAARLMALQAQAVCPQCCVAVRGAVEIFLESNSRQHANVRTPLWFKDVTVKWLFWDAMRSRLKRSNPDVDALSMSRALSSVAVGKLLQDALALTIDQEVVHPLIAELCGLLMDGASDYRSVQNYLGLARLCDVETCILHQASSMITFTDLSGKRKRRPPPSTQPGPVAEV
ncbi:hypothetical protein I4F81_009139 [Pyropia yezoensis]|uniref:Uncharacterized protein n=1 Tax=Pyropia yezoensis TaxID=2788 RepID=A0ACC3C9R1_PYRYE|nr:hypothetical protein I4F81_009139 [Neopyropia yezoensis]